MARIKKGELENTGVSQVVDSRLVMVNALYHFRSDTRVQPYVYGGVGHVSVDYTSRCFDCIFDQDPVTGKLVSRGVSEWNSVGSKMGVTMGGGVKIAINRHLSVRRSCSWRTPPLGPDGIGHGFGSRSAWGFIFDAAGRQAPRCYPPAGLMSLLGDSGSRMGTRTRRTRMDFRGRPSTSGMRNQE